MVNIHGMTYDDEGTTSGPRRNRSKDRGEEDGDEEADACDNTSKPGSSSLSDTSTTLHKHGDGRAADKSTEGYHHSVGAIRNGRTGEVSLAVVGPVAEAGHRVQGSRAVDDVDVEKGEERKGEVNAIGSPQIPLQGVQGLLDRMECDDVLEVLEPVVAFVRVWEVGDWRVPAIQTVRNYA